MREHKRVTLLVPVYNEQDALPLLHARIDRLTSGLPAYEFELLFVDDGSSDRTAAAACKLPSLDRSVGLIGGPDAVCRLRGGVAQRR